MSLESASTLKSQCYMQPCPHQKIKITNLTRVTKNVLCFFILFFMILQSIPTNLTIILLNSVYVGVLAMWKSYWHTIVPLNHLVYRKQLFGYYVGFITLSYNTLLPKSINNNNSIRTLSLILLIIAHKLLVLLSLMTPSRELIANRDSTARRTRWILA